jgi:hypothetical protein
MKADELLQQLDVGQIRERLADIDRERKALMTLLRAARQRERRQASDQRREGDE